jgi:hypothetical protein
VHIFDENGLKRSLFLPKRFLNMKPQELFNQSELMEKYLFKIGEEEYMNQITPKLQIWTIREIEKFMCHIREKQDANVKYRIIQHPDKSIQVMEVETDESDDGDDDEDDDGAQRNNQSADIEIIVEREHVSDTGLSQSDGKSIQIISDFSRKNDSAWDLRAKREIPAAPSTSQHNAVIVAPPATPGKPNKLRVEKAQARGEVQKPLKALKRKADKAEKASQLVKRVLNFE